MRRDETERESSYFINSETGRSHVGGTILGPLYTVLTLSGEILIKFTRTPFSLIISIKESPCNNLTATNLLK